MYLTQFNYKIN